MSAARHNVHPSLVPLLVPVDSIRGLTGNPRIGNVPAVAKSLERFGQRKPITVRAETGEITAGNHTWQAAKSLGWTHVAAVTIDDDEATAKAWSLADNRTAELGGYDDELLRAMIADVHELDPALLDVTGWDAALLEAGDADDFGDPTSQITGMSFEIVVTCVDEEQQRELLERFEADGLQCKAVVI